VPGLVLVGMGVGGWDVAMNIEGAAVEQGLGRSLMPRLHAGFSLGTVAGALLGAGAAALAFPLGAQLVLTAVLALTVLAVATRSFLPAEPGAEEERPAGSGVGRAWREPRTLLVGVSTLAFAFTEGTANDWLAVALVDGHGIGEAAAAVGFAVFVAAMTAVRLVGGALLARYGRVTVLRVGGGTAVLGLLLFVTAPALPVVLAGAVLWGAGAALGFPIGMSAAADDPARAAARVSVVSSISYTAFLAGPPLIGFVAEVTGVLQALLVVLVVLALGSLAAGATRPLRTVDAQGSRGGARALPTVVGRARAAASGGPDGRPAISRTIATAGRLRLQPSRERARGRFSGRRHRVRASRARAEDALHLGEALLHADPGELPHLPFRPAVLRDGHQRRAATILQLDHVPLRLREVRRHPHRRGVDRRAARVAEVVDQLDATLRLDPGERPQAVGVAAPHLGRGPHAQHRRPALTEVDHRAGTGEPVRAPPLHQVARLRPRSPHRPGRSGDLARHHELAHLALLVGLRRGRRPRPTHETSPRSRTHRCRRTPRGGRGWRRCDREGVVGDGPSTAVTAAGCVMTRPLQGHPQ
jgi:predicted MFS family arabinose efflux permease